MRFPVVLFDLDGTLVDSAGIILASFNHTTETVLQRRFPDDVILAQVGGGNLEQQMALFGPDRIDELVRVYRAHNNPLYPTLRCFDGIAAALATLKREGRRLGVVSAKRRETIDLAFDGAAIGGFFDVVVGSDETERHKPDPEPILLGLERLGVGPADAAYVGDSPFDMRAARGAGVHAVGVTWGRIHDREALAAADVVVDTPAELLAAL